MVKPSLLFLGVLLCIARKRKYPDFQELHSEVFRGEMVWCLKLKRRADRAKYCLWGSILAGNTWSSSFFKRTALQSRPTEPRDPHSRAFGPAPPNSGLGTWVLQPLSHLMAGASALCAGTGFPFGGAAGSTQAASENAVPHPELLISYRQWGRKGGLSYGWTQPGSANRLFRPPNKLIMINHTTESS